MIEISKKEGIKKTIDATRLTIKAIDEDMAILRGYVEGAKTAAHREHIPSEHYPAVYLAELDTELANTVFIRLHEDSPFICTGISLLTSNTLDDSASFPGIQQLFGLRLVDESSGRAITHQPLDMFIPMSVFKTQLIPSVYYQGQNFYYELPAEVAFPKNGVIRVEVPLQTGSSIDRYVALIGYKILGG